MGRLDDAAAAAHQAVDMYRDHPDWSANEASHAASILASIRRRSAPLGMRVAMAGSVVVIAAGTYWFVQRVFFPGGLA